MMRVQIEEAVAHALTALGAPEASFTVSASRPEHGDYSTNAALVAAKLLGQSPQDLAQRIAGALHEELPFAERIEVAGGGFVNVHLSRETFSEHLQQILSSGKEWGKGNHLTGQRIIVEYAQPNPFKPFHIGHLMSTAVGEAVSRLVENAGAHVFRANYQGDVGPHVAKCLWGLKKEGLDPRSVEDLGRAYVIGTEAYEHSPEAKGEMDEINKALYGGGSEWREVYAAGRETSLQHFEGIYRMLDTRFDRYFFESEVAPAGTHMVAEGLARGVFEESDGAVVYRGEKHGLHTRVFLTSHGTPTYEAKELGLARAKQEAFPFDRNITTVAVEQDGYFKVVERALAELIPELEGKYGHLTFGLLQLASGKMSSRKGNVITGESLIEDMRQKALQKMEERGSVPKEIATAVATAAIKYSILKQARGKNIIFDPEKSLSFEGDSGPYLQYAHVRACAILRRARAEDRPASLDRPSPLSLVERLLVHFPDVALRAAREFEPHYVATYLIELAGAFNSWYAAERVIDDTPESGYKLAVVDAFRATTERGLWLLGIGAPEEM